QLQRAPAAEPAEAVRRELRPLAADALEVGRLEREDQVPHAVTRQQWRRNDQAADLARMHLVQRLHTVDRLHLEQQYVVHRGPRPLLIQLRAVFSLRADVQLANARIPAI